MSPRLPRRRTEPAEEKPAGTGSTTTAVAATEKSPEAAPDKAAQKAAEEHADEAAEEPPEETVPATAGETTATPATARERRRTLAHTTPVLLLRASHPRQAVLTAAGLAVAAALAGRPGREVGLVFVTVLVGQAVLGWHNDLVDRRVDAQRLPSGKPIADGYLEPGTAWFALGCGVLLLVPLAVTNGVTAGCFYLASVGLGLMGNVILRQGWLSWLTWAASYALYPGFLSYGGWGGQTTGKPPEVATVVLAAALGVGVHVLCALPGLVRDHENGVRHLPLRIALKIGATRLLMVSLVWTALAVIGLLLVGNAVGLSQ
jgi:4-hydroxybenzoate polyprenyltransferase